MRETMSFGWRRLAALTLMASMFTLTIGINQTKVNAQVDNQKDRAEAARQAQGIKMLPETNLSGQPDVVFSNTTPITIPAAGNGNPYPSNITVSGVTGTITNVTVTLTGFTHTWPDDVAVLLVGPTGVKVRLLADAGGAEEVSNINLTFSDAAANVVPDNPTTAITTGTYRPTTGTGGTPQGNPVPANFPAPAPASPYASTLASFNNTAANGVWSLFVLDDTGGDQGSISGGWSIDITAGSTPPPNPKPCFDFFGSGRTSFATVGVSGNELVWRLQNNGGAGSETVFYGLTASDFPTPGYFDADNRADINVWRRGATVGAASTYYVRPSTAPTSILGVQWGVNGDLPQLEADYDGDGRDDPTVGRNVSGTFNWFYLRSSNSTLGTVAFGTAATDIPLPGADYNADGRADITVIRTGTGTDTYLVGDSNTGALILSRSWGEFGTDFYVVGDYVGDSRADFAVWRGAGAGTSGIWYIQENGGTSAVTAAQWGTGGAAADRDLPVCGDYNGDGKSDIAVYRRSAASFYWLNSGATPTVGIQAVSGGTADDFPLGTLKAR